MDDGSLRSELAPKKSALKRCLVITSIIVGVLVVLALVALFIGVPVLFYASSSFRRTMMFMAYTAKADGLNDPEMSGLPCSRNFFTTSDPGIRIGSWYMQSNDTECAADKTLYPGSNKVVLYLHGITMSRNALNRLKLLKMLTSQVHVHAVAIDYRGFGDSTNVLPSVPGAVNDSVAAYKRLRKVKDKEDIIIWGHSLGTGISMAVMAELTRQNDVPSAVILEAALDDIGSVARYSRYVKVFRWIPFYETVFVDSLMNDPNTSLNSTARVPEIDSSVPFLMLHSRDDATVPYEHGRSLYKTFLDYRKGETAAAPVQFITFKAEHRYGHNLIVFDDLLPRIVSKFINGEHGNSTTPDVI